MQDTAPHRPTRGKMWMGQGHYHCGQHDPQPSPGPPHPDNIGPWNDLIAQTKIGDPPVVDPEDHFAPGAQQAPNRQEGEKHPRQTRHRPDLDAEHPRHFPGHVEQQEPHDEHETNPVVIRLGIDVGGRDYRSHGSTVGRLE